MLFEKERWQYAPATEMYWALLSVILTQVLFIAMGAYTEHEYGAIGYTVTILLALSLGLVLGYATFISPTSISAAWEKFKSHTVIGHDLVLTRGTQGIARRVERIDRRQTHMADIGQYAVYVRLGGWFNRPSARIGQNVGGILEWVKSVRIRMTGETTLVVTGPKSRVPMELEHFLTMIARVGVPDPAIMLRRAVIDLSVLKELALREGQRLIAECHQHSQTAERLYGLSKILNDALDAMLKARGRIETSTRLRQRSPKDSATLDNFLKTQHDSLLGLRVQLIEETPNALVLAEKSNP